jgi:hypothetical protein
MSIISRHVWLNHHQPLRRGHRITALCGCISFLLKKVAPANRNPGEKPTPSWAKCDAGHFQAPIVLQERMQSTSAVANHLISSYAWHFREPHEHHKYVLLYTYVASATHLTKLLFTQYAGIDWPKPCSKFDPPAVLSSPSLYSEAQGLA